MMTKRIKLIYALLLAIALPLLTACSSEDLVNDSDPTQSEQSEKIAVRFRVSQAGTNTMRAWQDDNATDDEMMNVWTVVGVKVAETNGSPADEEVVGIWACKPSGEPDQEIDDTESILTAQLNKDSKYRFYSFANMSPAKVVELLGITSTITGIVDYMSTGTTSVTSFVIPQDTKVNYTTATTKTVAMSGNGFDPTATNAFGATGIPMSNVQEFNSLEDNDLKDLIVVRMLAKVELWLYNGKGASADGSNNNDIKINSITLTSVTKNGESINLFPYYYTKGGENEMESAGAYHGSIHPASDWTPDIVDIMVKRGTTDNSVLLEETPSASSTTNQWTIGATANQYVDGTGNGEDAPVKITFYVNESATPTTPHANNTTEQDFGHFYLELDVEGDKQETGKPKRLRYTMIDDKRNAEGEVTESWNYIARNDYRIIPIVLDDFGLDMVPYDFPAIGVLPASVKEEDGIYTISFHDYGHFHLQPKVTRYSDGSLVPYGPSGSGQTYWTLAGANGVTDSQKLSALTSVWGSWVDATKAVTYTNANASASIAFYRQADNTNSFTTTTTDGDEVGGEPVWYRNNSLPQWASDWATSAGSSEGSTALGFQPFIFGYIADPFPNGTSTDKLEEDRKVYHEFTINLYKDGNTSNPRTMIYRFYMILDTDQMLYRGDGSTNGAPRVRQPHCFH